MGIRITLAGKTYEAISYTVAEASTPIAAGDTSGQVGTIEIEIPSPDPDLAPNHPVNVYGTQVLIDDEVVLRDSRRGWTLGRVTEVSSNDDARTITLSCITRLTELNAYNIQANPFVGNLSDAFEYYLSLSPVDSDWFVDPAIQNRHVEFPGWTGELWFHLKQMAAALDVEIAFVSGIVLLRPIRTRVATRGREMTRQLSTNPVQLAQAVEIYQYNNRAITNELVYPAGGWKPEVSILSVNAGEEAEQQIELGASLSSFVEPVMQTFVAESEVSQSVYTVVADDGLPVDPVAWTQFGGSVRFILNKDTKTMTVKMVGAQGIPTAEGETSKSFSIALASDTSGSRYSTLRILGTGVAFDKKVIRIPTGVSPTRTGTDVGETIDNPFVSTLNDAYTAGVRAAKRLAGYSPSVSGTVVSMNRRGDVGAVKNVEYGVVQDAFAGLTYGQVQARPDHSGKTYQEVSDGWFALVGNSFENQLFGNAAGSRVWSAAARRWFRIRSVNVDGFQIRFEAEDDLTHGDVQGAWNGLTYGDVAGRLEGLSYQKSFLVGAYTPKVSSSDAGFGAEGFGTSAFGS